MAQQLRDEPIAKLEKLLDVAGVEMPWEEIARSLRRAPVKVLNALVYRTERARAESFEEGAADGRNS